MKRFVLLFLVCMLSFASHSVAEIPIRSLYDSQDHAMYQYQVVHGKAHILGIYTQAKQLPVSAVMRNPQNPDLLYYAVEAIETPFDWPDFDATYFGEPVAVGGVGLSKGSSLQLPDGLVRIGDSAFRNSKLKNLRLPDSLQAIGTHALEGNSFQELKLPAGLTTIEEGAFYNCGNLKRIIIPEENSAFQVQDGFLIAMDSMTALYYLGKGGKVKVPDGVKRLGSYSLDPGRKIRELSLPASLESIAVDALRHPSLVAYNLADTSEHYSVVEGVLFNPDGTTLISYPASAKAKSYPVPEMVQHIGPFAFSYVTALKEVQLGDGIQSVGDLAFNCSDKKTLRVNLPPAITSIGVQAFGRCTFSDVLVLPGSIQALGSHAFYAATFKELVIHDGITTVPAAAFAENKSLETVTLPASVSAIEQYAFSDCIRLKVVHGMEHVQSLAENAFEGCDKLDLASQ